MKASSRAGAQVDQFIDVLPQPEGAIAAQVRDLLFHMVPGIEEKFSFRLPFYHYYGMFCYIHFDKAGLHLCFCRGKDLVTAFPQLEQKARAAIASVTLKSTADLQRLEVPELIGAAAAWNKEAREAGLPMVQKRK